MTFDAYTLITAYLLSVLGLSSIALVEGIAPWFVVLTALAVLASLYFNAKKKAVLSSRSWNVLALAVLFLFLADFIFISGTLIISASRFLTILLVLKLFDLKTNRDHFIAFGIVFFQILGAAASTVSPVFFVILALFVATAIFVLMIFTMKKDWETHVKKGAIEDMPRGVFDGRFFAWIGIVAFFSLGGALMLFFILPRMGAGFFERKTLNTVKVTGFSDRVDLDTIGPVKTDGTIVMRVELPQKKAPPDGLYFRGTALDQYDGKIWNRELKGNKNLLRSVEGPISYYKLASTSGPALEQNIILEPLDTEVIFAVSHPAEVSGRFTHLSVDDGRSIYLPSTPYSRVEYKAWSVIGPLASPRPKEEKYLDTSYLADPAARARLMKLTTEVTKGQTTDFGKALAIAGYLRKSFSYTLSPKKGAGVDPIDDFLFFAKEGYCAQFASSMAMMLRFAGVPSRIVTGFLRGEWNGLGGYFIVRQMDAHSWVEAYVENNGIGAWYTFDPTPSAGTEPPPQPSQISLYLDLIRWRWSRYIVNYTFIDQRKVAENFEIKAAALFIWLRNALKHKPELDASGAMFTALAALLTLALYMLWRRAFSKARPGRKTPLFYLELQKLLEKKGYVRRPSETPNEFAARIRNPGVKGITELFERERYGNRPVDEAEFEKIRESLERLKKNLPDADKKKP